MNESKKLTIRIKFCSQQDKLAEEESLSGYHWGRIIGGSFLFILIISAVIGGFSYYFNQGDIADQYATSSTTAISPASAIQIDSSLTAEAESPEKTPLAADEFAAQTAVQTEDEQSITAPDKTEKISEHRDTNSALAAQAESPVTSATFSDEFAPQTAVQTENEQSITAPDKTEKISEHTAIKPTLSTQTKDPAISPDNENNNIMHTAQKEPALSSITDTIPLFRESKSEIFSDHIKRFVIASSVQNNEPVGTISDINFDASNIATVYAYSDVRSLEGKTIYYQWALDGKNIAKVRVDIGSSRWRSYSSKFIQNNKHGEWEVELQSEDGKKLASIQFIY